MDVILRSVGLEPSKLDHRVKLHFIARLMPLVEPNTTSLSWALGVQENRISLVSFLLTQPLLVVVRQPRQRSSITISENRSA